MKVFISYSNRNRDLVETLSKDLNSALGMITSTPNEVWFDEKLVGGQDWWNTILSHLLACDIFVFALSSLSIKSDACQRELKYATSLNKQILPVWITSELNAMDMPELMQARQWINYSKQDKAAFQDLVTALRTFQAEKPLPDPLPPPPAMPPAPLAEISHQLAGEKIDRDQQNEILMKLKDFLEEPDQSKDAYQLLLRLKQHPDLRRSVAEDIDDMLKDHPEFVPSGAPKPTTPLPDIQVTEPAPPLVSYSGSVSVNRPVSPSGSGSVNPPASASVKSGRGKWFGLNGKTIGLVIGIIGGIVYPQMSQECVYAASIGNPCTGLDLEYVIGSIIIWVAIGWGIDIFLARRKKNNTSTP